MYRIGIDVGGTFTDFTIMNSQTRQTHFYKVPSTPSDPSQAITDGIKQILDTFSIAPDDVSYIGHGTTVATNMIIERRGLPTALITTRGFRDVLAIGRQTRPSLYDLSVTRPAPLVEREFRLEANERILANGDCLTPLDPEDIATLVEKIRESGVKAVAVTLLHSYKNPSHEETVGALLREKLPGVYVSLSCRVLPEFREYERTSTTVLNAYVGPKMAEYFDRLNIDIREMGINVSPMTIHSNGGLLPLDTVKRLPVTTCLSGPAAGVIGAAAVGEAVGIRNIVTYDVGGTSTDVSLIIDGRPKFTASRDVAGYPVRLPMVDIHVIGAGGGSIAHVDDARSLKVGPWSAGAHPGPVAYGRGGTEPTLTDANICMQRLNPVALLNGKLSVNRDAAIAGIRLSIADKLDIRVEEAAYGILQVAVANMSRAIRAVTTEQGYDLSDITLFAFGGAGPLHAAEVAREAGIKRVLIPQEPGTMCARGALLSDISLDFVRMQLNAASKHGWEQACKALNEMVAEGDNWLASEKVAPDLRHFHLAIDAHYAGQNHDIRVVPDDLSETGLKTFISRFEDAHKAAYGYVIPGQPVVIVSCRVQAAGHIPKPLMNSWVGGSSITEALTGERNIYFGPGEGWIMTPVYRRAVLPGGEVINGPAIIDEMSSTTVILTGQHAVIDPCGNIIITN
ncbi:hydantoinase/oxoprolinase family protein [Pantoea sp. YR343]|uniref:hydantoinase/oxoprolinase family protein n=1 Tax=Pantoea sp. YR343 TaxID=1144341 RepID=UPI000271150A|nr:hydantoinase/oxoprolinase family protein [Pantoea sp. YR343]KAJ9431812.1 hydantoinase/oxoprolinase family protein [Pantoea sp. YR343]